jgi:hypothetical protein
MRNKGDEALVLVALFRCWNGLLVSVYGHEDNPV